MAAQKPLQYDPATGITKQVAALESSAGAGDEGKIVALNASGKIDATMMPADYDPEGYYLSVTAAGNIAAGDLVNYHNASGAKVRKADCSSNGFFANGFAPAAILDTVAGNIRLAQGTLTKTGHGLAIGATVYQDPATPGGLTVTPPSTTGQYAQRVGFVIDANTIQIDCQTPILL